MVALPRYQAQVAAPDARLDPALFTASGESQARAGLMVADLASSAAARYEQARQAQTLIREQAAVTRELNDLRSSFDGDTDWGTMAPRFEQRAAEIMQRRRQTLKDDPNVLAMLERDFTRDFERERVGVVRLARTRQTASGKADLETALQVHAENAAREADPAMRVEIEGRARAAIQGMVAAGFLAEDDGVKRETQFMDRVREARVLNLVRTDPEGAVRRLMDTSDQDFAGMDPAARERALRNAQGEVDRRLREDNARYDREQREADKRLRLDGERLVKDAYAALDRDGVVPKSMLDRLNTHGGVTAAEQRVILKAARGDEAASDDKQTVVDLQLSVDALEPDDFARNASRAVMDGRVTLSTFRSLVQQNKSAFEKGEGRLDREGIDYITAALDPVGGTGPLANIGRVAQANAKAEYRAWVRSNPKADMQTRMDEAVKIVRRFEFANISTMSKAIGRPRFLPDGAAIDARSLAAAEERVVAEMDAGRLSPELAALELRRIEDHRVILARTPAPRPAAQPGNRP